MKKISLSFFASLFITSFSFSQSPGIQWQQTLGTKYWDGFSKIIKTSDGGVLAVGYKSRDTADYWDVWAVKKNAEGINEWEKTFGGTSDDGAYDVLQMSDGSFIISGIVSSAEIPGHHGLDTTITNDEGSKRDIWVLKVSINGDLIWQKCIGGGLGEEGSGLVTDLNGNIYVCGWTESGDGDFQNKKRSTNSLDAFVVKLSPTGNILSVKTYGGNKSDAFRSMILENNELFIVGGTASTDLDVSGLHLNTQNADIEDIWFVHLDSNMNLIRQKCIGGSQRDYSGAFKKLSNNNFLICGYTGSADGDVQNHSPIFPGLEYSEWSYDGWLVELNANGDIMSQKVYGGNEKDAFNDFDITPAGDIIVAGVVGSSYNCSGFCIDAYGSIIKFDSNKNFVWRNYIGSEFYKEFLSVAVINDNNFYLSGEIKSSAADVTYNYGELDGWILRYGAVNTLIGKAFVDANTNNLFDTGEKIYPGLKIQSQKGVFSNGSATDINGMYSVSADTGTYITKAITSNTYYTITPASKTTSHSTYFNTDTIDFALQPIANKKDLAVSMWPGTAARPGFDLSYHIIYFNRGTTTIPNGKLKLKKDARLNFISALPVNTIAIGDTLVWDFSNLKPFDTSVITVNLKVATFPSVNIGDTLSSLAFLEPVSGDETPNDDTTVLIQRVKGSYDPNDKTELHGGRLTPAQLAGKEYLTYLIRFQNTGTDTAFNIFVRDTLDAKLDWNSLEMLGSSHNYNFSIKNGNQLEWFFTNIKLPDSNVNENASHGYIAYRIKPKPTLLEGDSVQNRASIYFDFNLPVNTNNDKTFIRSNIVTAVIDLNRRETQLFLYPNPSNGQLIVSKTGKIKGNTVLQLMDINGRIIRKWDYGMVNSTEFKRLIEVNGLPKGYYFIRLLNGAGESTGRFIIQ
jgi:Secretion system C-terminal sorting domain/Beta-propeller repeat